MQREWAVGFHGETYTKGCGVGMSSGVRSEGERVRGQSQLDSTQEKKRLRKGGEGVIQRLTDWTQWNINIELKGGSLTSAYSGLGGKLWHTCVMVRGNWQVTRPSLWMQKQLQAILTGILWLYVAIQFDSAKIFVFFLNYILILGTKIYYLQKETIMNLMGHISI